MSGPQPSAQARFSADALWAGEALVGRIRAALPALREVLMIDQYDPNATQPRQLPAAIVLLQAMRPVEANPQLPRVLVHQQWLVLLAVRSAAREFNANTAEAGPLIHPLLAALHGFKPAGVARGFAWVPGPAPSFGRDVTYFPYLFEIQFPADLAPAI